MSQPLWSRTEIADAILLRLGACEAKLEGGFSEPGRIRSFILDDVLPPGMAHAICEAFPSFDYMVLKRSVREFKYVAVQMNRYNALVEEAIFAFQDMRIVERIRAITGLRDLQPDPMLYAGGISAMVNGHYLSPHIDNSHDGHQRNYRALNLLFYVTPGWREDDGGGLELWDHGMSQPPRVIECKFNRLVVMQTDQSSLHSVSRIIGREVRRCVSNYYFSATSPTGAPYFNATSFRAWPGSPFCDAVLRADAWLRTVLLNTVLRGRYKNPHTYRK